MFLSLKLKTRAKRHFRKRHLLSLLIILEEQGPHVDPRHDLRDEVPLVGVLVHNEGVAVAELALAPVLPVEVDEIPADRALLGAPRRVVDAMNTPMGPPLPINIILLDTIANSKVATRIRHLRVDFCGFQDFPCLLIAKLKR